MTSSLVLRASSEGGFVLGLWRQHDRQQQHDAIAVVDARVAVRLVRTGTVAPFFLHDPRLRDAWAEREPRGRLELGRDPEDGTGRHALVLAYDDAAPVRICSCSHSIAYDLVDVGAAVWREGDSRP